MSDPTVARLPELSIPSLASSDAENILPVSICTQRTRMQHIRIYGWPHRALTGTSSLILLPCLAEQDGAVLVGTCTYICTVDPTNSWAQTACPVAAPESQSPQLLAPGPAVPLQLPAPGPALGPVTGTMDTQTPVTHGPTPAAGTWFCSPWSLPLLHHRHTGPPAYGLAPAAALRALPPDWVPHKEKTYKGI